MPQRHCNNHVVISNVSETDKPLSFLNTSQFQTPSSLHIRTDITPAMIAAIADQFKALGQMNKRQVRQERKKTLVFLVELSVLS